MKTRSVSHNRSTAQSAKTHPIVVVGNGPVGMQVVRELFKRDAELHIVLYGDEPQQPYNRVKLSSFLAGELNWSDLLEHISPPQSARFEQRYGIAIEKLYPKLHLVRDSQGVLQQYSHLILATGSRPFEPSIPGIDQTGVYTFRNLKDATYLLARQSRSHHAVVIGGGLLGMEAARAMQRGNTQVTLLEHGDRLLGRQLDETASSLLQKHLVKLGITVLTNTSVREIIGDARVSAIALNTGDTLACDTVIVATGIKPRVDLAREAGLAFGRGIRVDDAMRTSADDIYAIGECCEHRDQIYGLVAPGLEQAAVVASHIYDQTGLYSGSLTASRLKVVDCAVFSVGPMGEQEDPLYGRCISYRDDKLGIYRKIRLRGYQLVGAVAIGLWKEDVRLQNAVICRQFVWPWQLWRFRRYGMIWPQRQQNGVTSWPASATVCQCTGVSRGIIERAIIDGACSVQQVSTNTGASSVCGTCRPLVQQLLEASSNQSLKPSAIEWSRTLTITGFLSMLGILAIFILPSLPYNDSVQVTWRWDILWRDQFFKQVSGYSVLALFCLGLLISPRKRMQGWQRMGGYSSWRLFHVCVGILIVATLVVHSGARLGHGVNFWLMLLFCFTLLTGGWLSVLIGTEHRWTAGSLIVWRGRSLWWHVLAFWPIPVLLGFHILKSYWF